MLLQYVILLHRPIELHRSWQLIQHIPLLTANSQPLKTDKSVLKTALIFIDSRQTKPDKRNQADTE